MVPYCNGLLYCDLPNQQTLWDNYYMDALEQLRTLEGKYKIAYKAYKNLLKGLESIENSSHVEKAGLHP